MINKYYDSLIDFGEEHPAAQTLILTLADKVGAFIQDMMNKVLNVFVKVVETVKNAISAAINFISSTFNSIVNTTKISFLVYFKNILSRTVSGQSCFILNTLCIVKYHFSKLMVF